MAGLESKCSLWVVLPLFMILGSAPAHHHHEDPILPIGYGPSLVSLTQYDGLFRGPTLFSPDTGKTIYLRDYPNMSVMVPLGPNTASLTSNQVFIARRISGPGEFQIEAPKGYGVMAVVQSLDLRTASTGCNDFIQFGEVDGAETAGICGKVDNRDGSSYPLELVGPRVFHSATGRMRMLFYHGYIWGLVRNFNFDLLDPSRNPVLRAEVVFTAYKDCSVNLNETLKNHLRPCSPVPSTSLIRTCISSSLFCDKVLNCGFEDTFGFDEDEVNCHSSGQFTSTTSTTASTPVTTTTTSSTTSTTTTTKSAQTPTSTVGRSAIRANPSPPTPTIRSPTTIPSTSTTTRKVTSRKPSTTAATAKPVISPEEIVKPPLSNSSTPPSQPPTELFRSTTLESPLQSLEETHKTTQIPTLQNPAPPRTDVNVNQGRKMPLTNDGEFFVETEDNSVKYEALDEYDKDTDKDEGMDAGTGIIAGIVAITLIILIAIILLRIYYSCNKFKWHPHRNTRRVSKPPPVVMQCDPTELVVTADGKVERVEKVIKEKRKDSIVMPPAYDALFPIKQK